MMMMNAHKSISNTGAQAFQPVTMQKGGFKTSLTVTGWKACAPVLVSMVMGIFTLFGAVDISATTTPGNWSSVSIEFQADSDGNYTIRKESDLAAFANAVNGGETFLDKTIVLDTDLDMSASFWIPIGSKDKPFRGIFNGKNHKITGVIMHPQPDEFMLSEYHGMEYAGLFGYIGASGIVRNVTLEQAFIMGFTSDTTYAGGIAGYNCGTIENCKMSGSVTSVGLSMPFSAPSWTDLLKGVSLNKISFDLPDFVFSFAGGVVGYNNEGVITNCVNTSKVTAIAYTTLASAGGVAGYSGGGKITECSNSGVVKAVSTDMVWELTDNVSGVIKATKRIGSIDEYLIEYIITHFVDKAIEAMIGKIFNKAIADAFAKLQSVSIKGVANVAYAGGVVGLNTGNPIVNCSSSGAVDADASTMSSIAEMLDLIIGIVKTAMSGGTAFSIPIVISSIHVDSYAGGVAGWNNGIIDGCKSSGGADAHCFNLDFASLAAWAVLPSYTGGIVGYDAKGVIRNCSNGGALNSKSENIILSAFSGGSIAAHAGGIAGWKNGKSIENCLNSGKVDAYAWSVISYAGAYARAGGVAGILEGSGSITNCMSRGAVFSKWVNVNWLAWIWSNAKAGGVVGINESNSTIANCYWKKNGSSGFNHDATGKNNGIQKNCLQFDVAPGKVNGNNNVQDALNGWAVGHGEGYFRWSVVESMEGGYPFLSRPVAVTLDANNTKGSTVSPSSIVLTYGTKYGTLPTPTPTPRSDGYYFAGWFTATDAGQIVSPNTIVANDDNYTLYARWVTDWSMYATDLPTPVGNTYTLTTEGELAAFAKAVNGGNDFSGKTFVLANDLNLSAYPWVPAGMNSPFFTGTFDGQGHTVNGLKINSTDKQYVGLFGVIGANGYVQNVKLVGTDITGDSTTVGAGGLAGHNNGTIFNCSNDGTAKIVSSSTSGNVHGGGITGVNVGVVENCSTTGKVTASATSTRGVCIGGIVGFHQSGSILNCINSSVVDATVSTYSCEAGGIAGAAESASVVEGCANNGEVKAVSTSSDPRSGGVVGRSNATIKNCSNRGKVSASTSVTAYVGGVAGLKTSGNISHCMNSGEISSSSKSHLGGVVGYNAGDTVSYCSNNGPVSGASSVSGIWFNVGGVAGCNDGTVAYCFNGGKVVATASGAYPKAGGMAGYNTGIITYCVNTNLIDTQSPSAHFPHAGGMVGHNVGGTITNCLNNGSVSSKRTGGTGNDSYAGGVAGVNEGGIIRNCTNGGSVYTEAYVNIMWNTCQSLAGGVTGLNKGAGVIANCLNSGDIHAHATSSGWCTAYSRAGGVVGHMNNGAVTNCLNRGKVDGHENPSSYARVGGLVGIRDNGTISGCYWIKYSNLGASYNRDAVGTGGFGSNVATSYSFTTAPGSVNGGSNNLLTSLNNWVNNNGSSTYSSWVVTSGVNSGYPYLTNTRFVFTVFEGEGGNPIAQIQTHTPGATYGTLPTSTRTGYTLSGWFTAATGGTQITSNTSVTEATSRTLYAQWIPNTYTVTFNANGGTPVSSNITQTYDANYTLPTPDPTRTGYTFAGWWTANGTSTGNWGTQVTAGTTVKTTASQTLYARWTPNKYRVTFNGMGGMVAPAYEIVIFAEKYGYGWEHCELPMPERRGYEFVGWFLPNSGVEVTTNTIVSTASDHILQAMWKDKHKNITGDNGFGNDYNTNWEYYRASNWVWSVTLNSTNYIGTPKELAQFAWLVNQGTNFVGTTTIVTNDLITTTYGIHTNDLAVVTAYTNGLEGIPYTSYAVSERTNALDEITYTVTVTNDLSMAKYYWTPAGTNDTTRTFRGTFDGQGHAIQGITINSENELQYVGLFGFVYGYADNNGIDYHGIIQNVNLVDTDIVVCYDGDVYVGALVGYNDRGILDNCTNIGKICVFSVTEIDSDCAAHVGGLVGKNTGIIDYCTSSGTVEAFASNVSDVGGLVGKNVDSATIKNSANGSMVYSSSASQKSDFVGGMAGNNDGDVLYCVNNGTVFVLSADYSCAGGMAGYNGPFGKIYNCQNNGAVGAAATNEYFNVLAGGMAGYNWGYVRNSVNRGEISTSLSFNSKAGGVVGYNFNGRIFNCVNVGEVNSSSSGDLSGDSGGVVGYNDFGGEIRNCYWKWDDAEGVTDGFANLKFGHTEGGAASDMCSFSDAPGTLDCNVTVNGMTTNDLLTVLNKWTENPVYYNGLPMEGYYSGWTTTGSPDKYPVLACFDYYVRVMLDAQGGSVSQAGVSAVIGKPYVLPVPERKGYAFNGWFTEQDGEGTHVDDSMVVNSLGDEEDALILYAKWTQTHTLKTPVLVPYWWLDQWQGNIGDGEAYEVLAKGNGVNKMTFWESYVAGCDPTDKGSRFAITNFVVNAQSRVSKMDWTPRRVDRVYTVMGKTNLTDKAWHSPTNEASRFFMIRVEMP